MHHSFRRFRTPADRGRSTTMGLGREECSRSSVAVESPEGTILGAGGSQAHARLRSGRSGDGDGGGDGPAFAGERQTSASSTSSRSLSGVCQAHTTSRATSPLWSRPGTSIPIAWHAARACDSIDRMRLNRGFGVDCTSNTPKPLLHISTTETNRSVLGPCRATTAAARRRAAAMARSGG